MSLTTSCLPDQFVIVIVTLSRITRDPANPLPLSDSPFDSPPLHKHAPRCCDDGMVFVCVIVQSTMLTVPLPQFQMLMICASVVPPAASQSLINMSPRGTQSAAFPIP